jgi:hypothetical protein
MLQTLLCQLGLGGGSDSPVDLESATILTAQQAVSSQYVRSQEEQEVHK